MELRGTEFGNIFNAPGALGFFGEGYAWHKIWKHFGMSWQGMTLIAKTTTLPAREGNMPLHPNSYTPLELFPKCVVAKPLSGHVLNAVSLSGPGAAALFRTGRWQERLEPFMLSFMSVAATKAERLEELNGFVAVAKTELPHFRAKVALQINCGCPNVGLHLAELAQEIDEMLTAAAVLDIPLILNFNPLVPAEILYKSARPPALDGFCIGNSVPWGDPRIDWVKLFGDTTSPLIKRGFASPGGLSGPACLRLVADKVREARVHGRTKKIMAGNSVRSVEDVGLLREAGADAVFVGTASIFKPWRMRGITEYANSAW
jgi:dihydroorotate dehydrogenase